MTTKRTVPTIMPPRENTDDTIKDTARQTSAPSFCARVARVVSKVSFLSAYSTCMQPFIKRRHF